MTIGMISNKLHMEKNRNLAETYEKRGKRGKRLCIAEILQKRTASGFI